MSTDFYILLDLDGVMVSGASWRPVDMLEDNFMAFSPTAVKALNFILATTSATVVLTTSHKSKFSIHFWETIFLRRQIDVKHKLLKLDDNFEHYSRKSEIIRWLYQHPEVKNYVILDDDGELHTLPTIAKQKLITTKPIMGLTMVDAQQAIDIYQNFLSRVE